MERKQRDNRGAAEPGRDLVELVDVTRHYDVSRPWLNRVLERTGRRILRAVDGVSFSIRRGETFALVGESGCGKSTVARMVVGLEPPTDGRLTFDGVDIGGLGYRADAAAVRRRFQIVFQDPYASLNPLWRVGAIIAEPIRAFGLAGEGRSMDHRVADLLTGVGLRAGDANRYPHEFSGGQRQRISIARALAGEPEFLVCDEPTSALDVSVQAQILNLMKDLQDQRSLTYLFISHDMAVVRHMSDRVGVMYLGQLCEIAPTRTLFHIPRHPYTRMLIDTIPDLEMTGRERSVIGGDLPNPLDPPSGCPFNARCPHANDRCRSEVPQLIETGEAGAKVACHAIEEKRLTPTPLIS
ncbi:oligopeptide/dipeptide ABC transporter ATP-binding protein [Fodinicurvata sp. EGI_FJ10296]|uniref:ABC transporter ATP-binding protein n=1 Tax=Fodinicurvata sp. EGI_FJ10296 TaxID=3231908 RepID=UPI003456FA19